jgi:hypothetical protein
MARRFSLLPGLALGASVTLVSQPFTAMESIRKKIAAAQKKDGTFATAW